jgi:hypothetical protein
MEEKLVAKCLEIGGKIPKYLRIPQAQVYFLSIPYLTFPLQNSLPP